MHMHRVLTITFVMLSWSPVFAADYRAGYYEPRSNEAPPLVYGRPAYVPYVPPVYYMPSPPQYVQDLRTGAPGHWVQLQPTFLDRLFGDRNGY